VTEEAVARLRQQMTVDLRRPDPPRNRAIPAPPPGQPPPQPLLPQPQAVNPPTEFLALAMADVNYASDELVLHFPSDVSLGTVEVWEGDDLKTFDARGEVRLPGNAQAALILANSAAAHLAGLGHAVRDGLHSVKLRGAECNRSLMVQLSEFDGLRHV